MSTVRRSGTTEPTTTMFEKLLMDKVLFLDNSLAYKLNLLSISRPSAQQTLCFEIPNTYHAPAHCVPRRSELRDRYLSTNRTSGFKYSSLRGVSIFTWLRRQFNWLWTSYLATRKQSQLQPAHLQIYPATASKRTRYSQVSFHVYCTEVIVQIQLKTFIVSKFKFYILVTFIINKVYLAFESLFAIVCAPYNISIPQNSTSIPSNGSVSTGLPAPTSTAYTNGAVKIQMWFGILWLNAELICCLLSHSSRISLYLSPSWTGRQSRDTKMVALEIMFRKVFFIQ